MTFTCPVLLTFTPPPLLDLRVVDYAEQSLCLNYQPSPSIEGEKSVSSVFKLICVCSFSRDFIRPGVLILV